MFERGGRLRALQGPATGLVAQVLLLAATTAIGVGSAGLVVGAACAVTLDGALARGLLRNPSERLGPAGWVTLGRATLAVGVAALTAESFFRDVPVAVLVALATVALVLDYVDGWVARRTASASALGARLDGEVDAFLILVLSVYVARSAGAWVLAIGAARYAFLAAGWLLPWLREPLPPRYWRKVVAVTQGVVLTIAAADVLPLALTQAALVVALALLAESFGRDVWWLWSHRHATPSRAAAHARPTRGRIRARIAAVLTILSILLVWAALVAPNQPSRLTPSAFARSEIRYSRCLGSPLWSIEQYARKRFDRGIWTPTLTRHSANRVAIRSTRSGSTSARFVLSLTSRTTLNNSRRPCS
jgi:phosphatidylglycerophosphate synthase